MNKFHFAFIFASLLSIVLFTSSCQDPCEEQVCENGGICENGACQCPLGYTGLNCEEADILAMQDLLDQGIETPNSLYEKGVALEDIYGLVYEGGYLFFLDVNNEYPDFEGIVAGLTDVIDNAPYSDCYDGNGTKAEIGTGADNTQKIIDLCGIGTLDAASNTLNWVSEGKNDWFVPSQDELILMKNALLYDGNKGQFTQLYYWSSTENPDPSLDYQAFRLIMAPNPGGIPDGDLMSKALEAAVRAGRFF